MAETNRTSECPPRRMPLDRVVREETDHVTTWTGTAELLEREGIVSRDVLQQALAPQRKGVRRPTFPLMDGRLARISRRSRHLVEIWAFGADQIPPCLDHEWEPVRHVEKINVQALLDREEVQLIHDEARGGPRYCGSRGALITAGVVPLGTPFPGDPPGVRGPRFSDTEGRIWQITRLLQIYEIQQVERSKRAAVRGSLFQVRWFLSTHDLRKQSDRMLEQWREQESRKHEIAGTRALLKSMPADREAACMTVVQEIESHLGSIERLLKATDWRGISISMDAELRDEVKDLLDEVRCAVYESRIKFDPSARNNLQQRLTELRAEEAREDEGFQKTLGQILDCHEAPAE